MRDRMSELEDIAEEEGIEIMEIRGNRCQSMAIKSESGSCYIGLDERSMTTAEKIVHRAHELGHCVTGAFYNRYSPFDLITKHERRADVWAIKELISESELKKAFREGIVEIWELAEHFNVTEEFMKKVCNYYGYLSD